MLSDAHSVASHALTPSRTMEDLALNPKFELKRVTLADPVDAELNEEVTSPNLTS